MWTCGLSQLMHLVHNTHISSLCQAMGYKKCPWREKLMNWLGNKNLLWNFSGEESAQTTWLVQSCPHAWLQPLLSHHKSQLRSPFLLVASLAQPRAISAPSSSICCLERSVHARLSGLSTAHLSTREWIINSLRTRIAPYTGSCQQYCQSWKRDRSTPTSQH